MTDSISKALEYTTPFDSRTVTLYEYNPDKTHVIPISKYIEILNTFPISTNALDICNYVGCNEAELRSYALQYGITYKNVFKGKTTCDNSKQILKTIGSEIKPKVNKKTYKSIAFIKWKLYEFKIKKEYNKTLSEWVGVLIGMLFYFTELDELNYNKTTYVKDLCKTMEVADI
jgi:hypothetical protein